MNREENYVRFSLYRVWVVAKRVLKQFTRDKRTFVMVIVFPILFMFIFGMVLTGEVKNIPVSIQVEDDGAFGGAIYNTLNEDDRIALRNGTYREDTAKVDNLEIIATILIPENFTQDMIANGNGTIFIFIDGTKPQIKGTVYGALSDALMALKGSNQGITFEEQLAFGVGELSSLDVSIPGVMGYILTFLILLIAVLTAIREDVHKTKVRLFTTPLTSMERILGYIIALTFFALVETTVVLLISIFVFGAVVHGSLVLLFFAGALFAISHICLAFFLSNFAKNEFQSVQMAILIAIPSLALSGMMIPVITFPPAIAIISNVIPLTYGIRIFEGIMLRGWGITELWGEFTITILMTVAFFILALVTARDKRKE
ncbi:MAG: ABC transporter permease [Promethearchaeota archaeon]